MNDVCVRAGIGELDDALLAAVLAVLEPILALQVRALERGARSVLCAVCMGAFMNHHAPVVVVRLCACAGPLRGGAGAGRAAVTAAEHRAERRVE